MTILRWAARIAAALIVLIVIAIGAVYVVSNHLLTQHIEVAAAQPIVDLRHGDTARGEHLVHAIAGCSDCHGANLGGRLFISDPALGTVYAPNLTRGTGGAASTYTDADWVRALRHGVRRDGTPLLIMPSQDFAALSDADLAAIVSYIVGQPPVANTTPRVRVGPVGRALYATRQLPIAALEIQRTRPQPSTVRPGVSVAYGAYLARAGGCMSCHGAHLSGGHLNGAPSDPPAQNLTPAGDLGHWTFDQFRQSIRTGVRPNGTHINTFMPWPTIAQMTDDELLAIYKFLKSVPPRPTGNA
jgi:cytochrome c553